MRTDHYEKVMRLKDGRFVKCHPPIGGLTRLRKFHYYSPLDYIRWAYARIATPLHFWRVRRYARAMRRVS